MTQRRSLAPLASIAAVVAVLATLLVPAIAAAHPLGNFTINHHAGLRIEPDRVRLDIVIDEAEIPAFQSRQALDTDADGSVGDEEATAGAAARCHDLAADLHLAGDGGADLPLTLTDAGLTFPLGASGLSTLRLVCAFDAPLAAAITDDPATRLTFSDTSSADRLGWREIVVTGDGVRAEAIEGELRATSPSDRLTRYPESLISQPLADAAIVLELAADPSVVAAPFVVPDAAPVRGVVAPSPAVAPVVATPRPAPAVAPATSAPAPAAVPGGIGGELPAIFNEADVTPLVLLLSVVTAAALGAAHALTPGHGKTLMAAYLVGTRGGPLHAVGLGLSVSVSHTVGILVLAAVVIGAADVLSPDLVVRTAPVIAAVSILGIGAWMLIGEVRRRRVAAVTAATHAHDHDDDHGHDHGATPPAEHRHGGVSHAHVPAPGTTITWRGLFALGLAGGLIPSTSALLILLGAIAAGRPGFGFILVVAFGLGMAAVMGGIGLALVFARERLERVPSRGSLGRVREVVPLVAALLVFGFGIWLTVQAVAAAPVL